MNVILPDMGEQHMLRVKNGVLLVYADTLSDDADVSISCPKNALFAILTNNQETVAKAREKTARCFQRKSKAVCFCWEQTAFAVLLKGMMREVCDAGFVRFRLFNEMVYFSLVLDK